jgi:hypothetical protein
MGVGWRLHLVSGLLLSRHFQMRDGVCIERNDYHVNTSCTYRFDCILNMSCCLFCCMLLLHHAVWKLALGSSTRIWGG